MAVLKDMSQLGLAFREEAVPLDAFQNEAVPVASFTSKTKMQVKRGEAAAYVKRHEFLDPTAGTKRCYAMFHFTKSFMTKYFKGLPSEAKFRLEQGNAPNNHWFKLVRDESARNTFKKDSANGLKFSTTEFVVPEKLDMASVYRMSVHRVGTDIYLKLPNELVPLLVKG
jgi:hypothetical protein